VGRALRRTNQGNDAHLEFVVPSFTCIPIESKFRAGLHVIGPGGNGAAVPQLCAAAADSSVGGRRVPDGWPGMLVCVTRMSPWSFRARISSGGGLIARRSTSVEPEPPCAMAVAFCCAIHGETHLHDFTCLSFTFSMGLIRDSGIGGSSQGNDDGAAVCSIHWRVRPGEDARGPSICDWARLCRWMCTERLGLEGGCLPKDLGRTG
jgi:hypothetical protein